MTSGDISPRRYGIELPEYAGTFWDERRHHPACSYHPNDDHPGCQCALLAEIDQLRANQPQPTPPAD